MKPSTVDDFERKLIEFTKINKAVYFATVSEINYLAWNVIEKKKRLIMLALIAIY